MKTKMTFGECLKYLLVNLDISMNRLAKAINVDSSLVNRWIHGTRIPRYGTSYIENIAEYLSNNFCNTYQIQILDKLLIEVGGNCDLMCSNEEKVKKILFETQGYTIEKRKIEMKQNNIAKEEGILTNNFDMTSITRDSEYSYNNKFCQNIKSSVSLSSADKIILGAKNIFLAFLDLLEYAIKKEVNNEEAIYITYNSYIDCEDITNNDLVVLRNILIRCINKGWQVVLLIKIKNIKFKRLLNFIIPLIKTGSFHLYNYKKYGTDTTDVRCVVTGVGALSCLPTQPYSKINSAFYLENKVAVDIFRDHFRVLLDTKAQLLLKYYVNDNKFECYKQLEFGDHYNYNYSFNLSLLPESIYRRILIRNEIQDDEILTYLDGYKKQINAFKTNIQTNEYKDILFLEDIKRLIESRQFYFQSFSKVEVLKLEVHEIIEFLQNLISFLKTYNKYYIAIISRDKEYALSIKDCYCFIEGRQNVLFKFLNATDNLLDVQFSIDEPMMVQAFDQYFEEFWERIAPINKDKDRIIAWIQKQIESLK